MDTNSISIGEYFTHAWYAAPYFGLVLVSIWLFRRATKWEAWLMLGGSVMRACDMFMLNFVLAQGTGLWPMPADITAPGAAEQFRLHLNVQSFFQHLGSWGMVLFIIGLLLFSWRLHIASSVRPNRDK